MLPLQELQSAEIGHRSCVVQPDPSVVLREHADIVTDRIWGAPDLVIEVLSPRPRIGTMEERLGWFPRYGVRECWLVHLPGSRIEVVTFRDRARQSAMFEPMESIRSQVLPGIVLRPEGVR